MLMYLNAFYRVRSKGTCRDRARKVIRRVGSPCMLTMFLGVMTSKIFRTCEILIFITNRTIAAML